MKYNLSVTFCSVPERICPRNGLKMREISQGCAFLGFRQKMVTPTPTSPEIPKILHYKSHFSLKTRINVGVRLLKPPKFVVEWETAYGDFNFGDKN